MVPESIAHSAFGLMGYWLFFKDLEPIRARGIIVNYNLVPRALFPGFGGGDIHPPHPKSMEKRVGDEVVGIINKINQTNVTHNK